MLWQWHYWSNKIVQHTKQMFFCGGDSPENSCRTWHLLKWSRSDFEAGSPWRSIFLSILEGLLFPSGVYNNEMNTATHQKGWVPNPHRPKAPPRPRHWNREIQENSVFQRKSLDAPAPRRPSCPSVSSGSWHAPSAVTRHERAGSPLIWTRMSRSPRLQFRALASWCLESHLFSFAGLPSVRARLSTLRDCQ